MTTQEFSNEFDVLYNSITSNNAPGLDEYEKSVFLTKAQYEILGAYFNSRSNKTQEGYDDSRGRQIDFSTLTSIFTAQEASNNIYTISFPNDTNEKDCTMELVLDSTDNILEINLPGTLVSDNNITIQLKSTADIILWSIKNSPNIEYSVKNNVYTIKNRKRIFDPLFDNRPNSLAVLIPEDAMFIINEMVEVNRNNKKITLVTIPLKFDEYNRLMSKPFKRPVKSQSWRLINNDIANKADIVIGSGDEFIKYICRYVRRPKPIILDDLDGLEIEGFTTVSECELDPTIHYDILQRAVELAKAAYTGGLNEQLILGNASQTNIGIIPQSK